MGPGLVGRRKTWILGAAVALLAASLPASRRGRSTIKGALLLTEILPSPVHPLSRLTSAPSVRRIDLPHGKADLYVGRPGAPGVVLVHGGNIGGIDDPRIQGVAAAICRLGRSVVAPSLALGERRLDPDDSLRILDAIDYLADATGGVCVVAFSYGAALTLCALAERPSIQARVRLLATIGTYFDVVHLIEGVTTGQVCVNGSLHPWQPPPAALEAVEPLLAEVLGGRQLDAVNDIVSNRDPRRTATLVEKLPTDIRDVLDRVSPARHIGAIRVPLLALHSRVDLASPAVESEQLVEAVRRRARTRLTLVGSLRHVTPVGTLLSRLKDVPGLVGFAAGILRAQEGSRVRPTPAP